MTSENSQNQVIEISDFQHTRSKIRSNSDKLSFSQEEINVSIQNESNSSSSSHDGGSGGGGNLNERLSRLEAIEQVNSRLLSEIRSDLKEINSSMNSMEKRILDKSDENHKWVIGLIISSILVPLLIALVTK